jgi:hypothetical protein
MSRSPRLRLIRLGFDAHRMLMAAYIASAVAGEPLSPAFTVATGALVAAMIRGDGAWLAFAIASALYLVQRSLVPVQQARSRSTRCSIGSPRHAARHGRYRADHPPHLPSVLDGAHGC